MRLSSFFLFGSYTICGDIIFISLSLSGLNTFDGTTKNVGKLKQLKDKTKSGFFHFEIMERFGLRK